MTDRENTAEALADYFAAMCAHPASEPHMCDTLIAAHDVARLVRVTRDEPEGGCWHPIEGCPAACGFGCWLRHPLTPPANHPSSASDDRPATAEVPGRASPDPDGREGAGAVVKVQAQMFDNGAVDPPAAWITMDAVD